MTLLELVNTPCVSFCYWLLSTFLFVGVFFFLGLRNFLSIVLRNLSKSSPWRFVDVLFWVSLISSLQEETRKHEINRLLDEMLSLEKQEPESSSSEEAQAVTPWVVSDSVERLTSPPWRLLRTQVSKFG